MSVEHGIVASPGLLIAPFADGAAVFDTLTETAHLVGPLAAWLLGSDETADLDELVELLIEEAGADPTTARRGLEGAVDTLTGLGLLGRSEHPESPTPRIPRVRTPEPDWFVGATHGVLDRYLAFCGPDRALVEAVDDLLGSPVTDVDPTLYFGLVPDGSGGVDVIDDSLWHFTDVDRLLWQLPTIVNDTVSHSESMVVLHAGAVRTPGGRVVVVSGPMNTGKSTLVAALLARGCDYLGDESIGIDASSLHAWAYPKPLTLDPTSQALVGLDPVGAPLTPGEHRRPEQIRREVSALWGDVGGVDLVLHTAYRPQSPASAVRLSAQQAIELLLGNTLNLVRSGNEGLATLCRVAESVPVVSITHGDTLALAERVVATGADPDRLATETSRVPVGGRSPDDAWWHEWQGVRATPQAGLRVFPLGVAAGALAVVPGCRSTVLDAHETAVCTVVPPHTTLADAVDRLGDVAEGDVAARRVAVVEAARRLEANGLVELDRSPDVPLPDLEPPNATRAGSRRLPVGPRPATPAARGGVSSATAFGFDLDPRSGAARLGTITVTAPAGTIVVDLLGDVDAPGKWLATLPPDVADAAGAAGSDPRRAVRVLGLPGTDGRAVLVATPSGVWGPLGSEDVPGAICRAVAHLVGVRPPDGRRLGWMWLTEQGGLWQVSTVGPGSDGGNDVPVVRDEVWLAADAGSVWTFDAAAAGRRIGESGASGLSGGDGLWQRRPLERIVLDEALDDDDDASLIAATVDLMRRASYDDDLGTVVDLAVRCVAAHGVGGRSAVSAPITVEPPVASAALAEVGAFADRGRSVKLNLGAIADRRRTWTWTLPVPMDPDARDRAVQAIGEFATGHPAAEVVVGLDGHDGRFVVGVDLGDDGTTRRHKLYLEVAEMATWTALAAAFPTVAELHDASVISPAGPATTPPRFVAWKRVGPDDRTVLSVYRRQHDPGVTVSEALRVVLPTDSDWFEPVCAFVAFDRDLAAPLDVHDLEVIEEGGRHSIDLHVAVPTPHGDRFAVAHWLAALAGVGGAEATAWATAAARHGHHRLIVGTDAEGDPFVSVYHV